MSKVVEIVVSEPYSVTIVSTICSELYGLDILKKDIQDGKSNIKVYLITIFFIIINFLFLH